MYDHGSITNAAITNPAFRSLFCRIRAIQKLLSQTNFAYIDIHILLFAFDKYLNWLE